MNTHTAHDYNTPVCQWLQQHNVNIEIAFSHKEKAQWLAPHDKRPYYRDIYDVTITREGKAYTFKFHDSIANTSGNSEQLPVKHKRLTEYDVLSCLTWYEPPMMLQDFMDEFGYDNADAALGIWYAVKEEYQNLARLFDQEERNSISELAN